MVTQAAGAQALIIRDAWRTTRFNPRLAGAFSGVTFPVLYVRAVGLLGSTSRMGSAILTLCLAGATLGPLALRPLLGTLGGGPVFGIAAVVGAALAMAFAVVLSLVRPGAWGRLSPERALL